MSYLGKISAIVSANTADFTAKLNGSAKEVRKFASSVESTIGAASRQAAASLANIYTPLQKVERALQAAGRMPLSFTGFAGAIKNIDELKKRLASGLNDRQVAVVVKASGMASVDEFHKAIQSLNSRTVDVIAKVGGLEQLRALREQMISSKGASKIEIDVTEARAKVESLRAQLAAAMEGGTGGNARAVGRLEKQLATATQALEVLKKAASSGDAAFVKRLDRKIDEVATKLRNLEQRRMRAINAGVDSSQIAEIGKQIDKTAAKLERLENKKASIGVSTEEFDEKIAEAENKVAGLRKKLEEAKSTGDASGIAQIKEELAAAEKRADSLTAKLNKKVGVDTKTGLSLGDVNAAIAVSERLGISLEKAREVAVALGESDYQAARSQLERLVSVSEEITKPLGQAAKTLSGLGADVQGGFLPALSQSQAAAERLVQAISKGVQPAAAIETFFAEVRASAAASADAVTRLAGASQMLGNLKTGKEITFASPELTAALARGAEIGNSAAALPASALSANPKIVEGLKDIYRLADLAVAALSRLEAAKTGNLQREIDAESRSLENLIHTLTTAQDRAKEQIKIVVDDAEAKAKADGLAAAFAKVRESVAFAVSGQVQNFDQARQESSRLRGAVGSLEGGRGAYQGDLQRLGELVEKGDVADLQEVNDLISRIDANLAERKQLDLDDSRAKEKLNQFAASIESLKQRAGFEITGKVENASQVESEIARIIGKLDQLDEAGRAAVAPRVNAAIASLGAKDAKGNPDIAAMQSSLDALSEEFDKQHTIKVNAADARSSIEKLRESLAAIATTLSPVNSPMDSLKASADAARAAVDKVTDATKRSQLQSRLASISGSIASLSDPSNPALAGMTPDQIAKQQARLAARLQQVAADAGQASRPTAADTFGPALNSSKERLASLQSAIQSTQSSIAALPKPLRDQMIPALNGVRNLFASLGDNPTARQLRDASREADNLEKRLRRAQDAAKFTGTMRSFINQSAVGRYEAQLKAIKNGLLAVGATAGGPVAAAVNQYERALREAAKAGRLGTQDTKQQMASLLREIERVAVATGLMTQKQAAAFSRGIASAGKGDVSRMGVDKFSLALNQAAFAVDDFMSSTGGMEFKLRAISNNITQLAFVLGGTTGLFIGLGTVIGGQAALQILKFVNGGRTAEDQTKALNDALARQKSLVEELAQAFRSLGDAMARDAFSDAGGRRRDVDKSLEDIRKKQQERRRESIASVDPEVLKERATQASLNRQISQQTDVGQILNLQRKLRESQERERTAADAAVGRKPPGAADVGNELRQSFARMTDAATMDAVDEASAAAARAAGERRQAEFVAPRDLSEARAAIIARQKELGAAAESGMLTPNSRAGATEEIRRLQAVLESLDAPLKKSLDEAANKIVEDSRGPAEQIRQAQEEVAKAIEAGAPGAREFQRQLDKNATRLAEAYRKLEQAAAGVDENGRPLTADQSQKKVEEAQADIARLEARRSGLAAQADALRYERIVDPQRQLSSVMDRARGNLRDAGLGDGSIARRLREIEADREQLRSRAQLPEFQTPEMVRNITAAEEALKEEAAAIEATTLALKLFGDALDRASGEAKGNLNSAQQRADEARRNDLAMGTPESLRERQRAEANLATQRRLEADAQREIANQRAREEAVKRGPEFVRMNEIDAELRSGAVDVQRQEELRAERSRLEEQVQPQIDAARQRSQDAAEASTREEELQKSALRGLELTRGPEWKFAEETARGLGDIRERFRRYAPNDAAGLQFEERLYMRRRAEDARTQTLEGRGAEAARTDLEKFALDIRRPGGLVDALSARRRELAREGVNQQDQADFLRSALNQQMEEAAPMLKGFDDERRNAMLQGPSRAALGVSDITTSQGMSELNRLLRGDDPAKDVNLAELRKQTEKFDELIRAVRDANPGLIP